MCVLSPSPDISTSLPIKHTEYCDITPHITALVLSKQPEPPSSQRGTCLIPAESGVCTRSSCDRPVSGHNAGGGVGPIILFIEVTENKLSFPL